MTKSLSLRRDSFPRIQPRQKQASDMQTNQSRPHPALPPYPPNPPHTSYPSFPPLLPRPWFSLCTLRGNIPLP